MALTYRIGDAVHPHIYDWEKRVAIAHLCNDANRWGAGFSGALSRRFPQALARYRKHGKILTLCSNHYVQVDMPDGVTYHIVNMVAQRGITNRYTDDDSNDRRPDRVRYDALRQCLCYLHDYCLMHSVQRVIMPMIGAGLAGGDWLRIEGLICQELATRGIPVSVYMLNGGGVEAPGVEEGGQG